MFAYKLDYLSLSISVLCVCMYACVCMCMCVCENIEDLVDGKQTKISWISRLDLTLL